MAREQKTSFNISSVPVAKYGSSYQHQKPEHRAKLNYIHSDRSQLNESWHRDIQENGRPKTLRNYLADTKRIVKAKTGRAMQKKAEDYVIGEAVVVIDEKTTMEELQLLGKKMEDRYGWTCVQIHIHKDEGYLGKRTKEMKHREGKYNLHAHMFFITTNLANGKSWKRKRGEGSVMQDITAQTLNLTRGVRKSEQTNEVKETLNVIEFKEDQALKNLERIEQEKADIQETLKNDRKELNEIKEEKDTLDCEVYDLRKNKRILEDDVKELEYLIRKNEEVQDKQYSDIINKHKSKGLFGTSIDYEAVSDELAQQIKDNAVATIRNDFVDVRKARIERNKAVDDREAERRRYKILEREFNEFKSNIIEKIGKAFEIFLDDMRRYKDNLLMAINLWHGGVEYNETKTEEYTADKKGMKFLINGETIDVREEKWRQKCSAAYNRAFLNGNTPQWIDHWAKLIEKENSREAQEKKLEEFEKIASRGQSRGIRR